MRSCLPLPLLILLLGKSNGYSLFDAKKAARSLAHPNSLFRPPVSMIQRDTIQMPSTTPMVPFKVRAFFRLCQRYLDDISVV